RWLRRGNPQALHHRCWQPGLARLGETLQALEVHVPVLHAVTYPEIVALTGMLASPFWTAMANSDHAVNRDRFYRETARRLGVPSVDPTDSLDPLFQWTYDLRYGQIGRGGHVTPPADMHNWDKTAISGGSAPPVAPVACAPPWPRRCWRPADSAV